MANEARWPKMMWEWGSSAGLSQESMKVYNHFDRLCDELLTEILLRLPNCKSVFQSLTVCKRWAALASCRSFILNFISLKHPDADAIAFIIHFKPDRIIPFQQRFESFFRPSIFNVQDLSFSPLGDDDIASVSPEGFASCNDLLLYYKHNNDKYDYYISNIQTRQCVVLPSLLDCYGKVNVVGFICDAFFSCDREPLINAAYHYSVVVAHCTPRPSNKLNAHIFSSHLDSDTQWFNKVLALPQIWRFRAPRPSGGFSFCFDGKLHFSCFEGFFGFDHNNISGFEDEIECHLVKWPVGMLLGNHRLSVSQENLYLSDYCNETAILKVWFLHDYKEGNWMLQHVIQTHEWVSCDTWSSKKLQKFYRPRVLGLHPSYSHVIYVVVPGCIFLCNLANKMVELACEIPITKGSKHHLNNFYALPVIFQGCPTPLPRLAHSLTDGVNATLPSCSRL